MKDFKSLKILDKISGLFNKMGVDYDVMRKILQLNMVMDERRQSTVLGNQNNKKSSMKTALFLYAFLGLFTAIIIVTDLPLYIKMNVSFGIIIFMIMSTMISDYSSILLDNKDKNILGSKPIDIKTINVSKIVHIAIYLISISLAYTGPSMVVGLVKHGILFFVIMLVSVILILAFIILFTSLLYYLILKLFNAEKVKDFINYFQIGFSIIMVVFYQIMGRMFDIAELGIVADPKWWNAFIPSSWFAGLFELVINKNYNIYYIAFSILAILIPVISVVLYVKVVSPYFESKLAKTDSSSNSNTKTVFTKKTISNMLCKDKTQNVFYRFTLMMIKHERKLKLRIYPSLAIAAIFPFIMIFTTLDDISNLSQSINALRNSKIYFFIYIVVLMLPNVLYYISTSEKFKGAWIYKVLPLDNYDEINRAAFKATVMKFCIPIYIFVSVIMLVVFGIKIAIDIIIGLFILLIISLLLYMATARELPFSKEIEGNQNNIVPLIQTLLLSIVFVGLHYGLSSVKYANIAYLVVLVLLYLGLWNKFNFAPKEKKQ